jgi:hypothetical protein
MPGLRLFNTPTKRADKVKQIREWYNVDTDERSEWLGLQETYWNLYAGKVGRPVKPWEGASDIHWPLIETKIESIVPRYIQSLFGADPIARVIPTEHSDVEESDDEEKYLTWALRNHIPNFYTEMNNWIRTTCIAGTGVLKIVQEDTWRKSRQKHILSRYVAPGETFAGARNESQEPIEVTDEDIIDHYWHVKDAITSTGEHRYKAKVKQSDKWVDAEIEIEWPETDDEDKIEVYIASDMLVYSGPLVSTLNLEDIYTPFRGELEQHSHHIIEECYVNLDTMAARREEGLYKFTDKEWKEIVEIDKKYRDAIETEDHPRQEAIDDTQGVKQFFKDGKFSLFEVYAFDDVDDDYRDEHMIYSMVPAVDALCRAQYLEEQFPHGHRPYAVLRYKPIPKRFYGRGVAEMLAGLQVEANTIVNLTNDREHLINLPFFFFEPAPGTDPTQHISVEPGEGIPIASGTQITFPNWAKNPVGGVQILDLISQVAEELVKHGPMQSGQRAEGKVPSTARGTSALLAEGNIGTNADIKLAQEGGFKEMLYQVFSLLVELGPEERYYRVVGEPKPRKMTRDSMKGRYDFQLSGNTTNTNPEIQQQKASQMYMTMAAEPLYQQDLAARREMVKNFLRKWNDGDLDIDSLTPNVPVMLRPRTPEEVIGLLIQGLRAEPRQGENFEAIIAAVDRFASSPEIEMVPKEYVALFAEAVQAYQTMGQLQEQMSGMMSRSPKMAFQPGGNETSTPQGGLAPIPTEGMQEAAR